MVAKEFSPTVSDAVWERFGQYRALSVTVKGYEPVRSLARPEIQLPEWTDAHVAAWHEVFRQFGANPKRTPPSVDSLLRRYRKDGMLPAIDPVVDLYNALSLGAALPAGGEDMALYKGSPRLVVAEGGEEFDTMREGQTVVEVVEAGEVVWRDDVGVTCRRWNWRQCRRTAISPATRDYWFVFDRLPPVPIDVVFGVGEALVNAMREASPGCAAEMTLLQPSAGTPR